MSLQLDGIDGPVDWPVTPGDDVSEQLRVLFSGREMKDGDSIVFAPGTYHLNSTVILYDHDAEPSHRSSGTSRCAGRRAMCSFAPRRLAA